MSSGAISSKQYTVGYATFRLSELLSNVLVNKYHFSSPVRSDTLLPYASIDLYVVSNKKYPLLGGSGWSLSDPMPDTCRALQAPFCPPLEQIYALKAFQPPKADTSRSEIPSLSFPHGVVLAVERTQESSVILPVSICVTRLLAEAAMHSANHADSVARRLKANALKFQNPFEAYENNHAECVLGLCCLVRFDSQVRAPDNPHYQRLCAVKVSLQAPDCIFELPVGGSQIPVHFGGGHQQQAAKEIPYVTSSSLSFYPKPGKPNYGVLRFETRQDNDGPSNTSGAGVWEGYADIDIVKNNPKGAFLEIPMFATQPAPRMVATLVIQLTLRNPPSTETSPSVLSPSLGLISLMGMASLSDSLLDCIGTVAKNDRLGDFISMEWIDEHAKKRHLDAGNLVSRYESYRLALQKVDPQHNFPPYQRRCPGSFRASTAKTETLLSGIPLNAHVQSLVLEPLVTGESIPRTWFNVTCGAAADHPRGFTATGSKPGGAGGVRRLELKREEMARLSLEAQEKLSGGLQTFLKENKMRRFIPHDDNFISTLRAACYRAEQKLFDLTWEVALRRGNVFSQILGIALTAYLAAVSDVTRATPDVTNFWVQHGFLLCFEGLLSSAGKETAMIEDASAAISMLKMVKVELVDGGTFPLGNKSVAVEGSKVIKFVELVREQPSCVPTASGLDDIFGALAFNAPNVEESSDLLLRVALDPAFYANRTPLPLRNGVKVRFYAMLFQMGVDIMQWSANKLGTAVQASDASGPVKDGGGEPFDDDEDDDEAGTLDTDFLITLNNEAFVKLNKYAFNLKPVEVNAGVATVASRTGIDPVHPILEKLWQNICDSARKMEHGVLDTAGAAADQLGGSGVIFCKSGKDRTAMQVTLKQSQFLRRVGVRKPDKQSVLYDAMLMRIHGTRLAVCEKNVGQPKYAFNALQVNFMPELLKPPLGSVAGFLKGGRLFSREGAIES
jgi:hypothetical protein